jgi:hypothetical protein
MKSALLPVLCSLCPVEPACERRQMREYLEGLPAGSRTSVVAGQPYRCWLLHADAASSDEGRPAGT